MIHVVVVEDFPLIRAAIAQAINAERDMQVVRTCGDADGAREAAAELAPDVMVLDLHLHSLHEPRPCNTMALLEQLSCMRRPHVVAYSASEHPTRVTSALDAGAVGYVSKRQHASDLIDAIRRAAAGDRYVAPHVAGNVIDAARHEGQISAWEAELFELLGTGLTDAQIAERMFLSRRTIQKRMAVLRERTRTSDRHELIRWAIANDWIASSSGT